MGLPLPRKGQGCLEHYGSRSKRPAIGPTIPWARHDGDLGDPGSPRSPGSVRPRPSLRKCPEGPGQQIISEKRVLLDCLLHSNNICGVTVGDDLRDGGDHPAEPGLDVIGVDPVPREEWAEPGPAMPARRAASDTFPAVSRRSCMRKRRSTAGSRTRLAPMQVSISPVENGLVASLARPGGNITGLATSTEEVPGK